MSDSDIGERERVAAEGTENFGALLEEEVNLRHRNRERMA
jgi:hypothetical protein